jgi:hypothetical protein
MSAFKAKELASSVQEPVVNMQERVMSDPTREEIGALIGASEARNETKLTRLEGKIDTLTATIVGKIDALSNDVSKSDQYSHETRSVIVEMRSVIVVTMITVGFALAGLIVAIVTYGDAIFGRGMNVRDVVQAVIKEQQEIQKKDAVSPSATPVLPAPSTTPVLSAPPATPVLSMPPATQAPSAKTKPPG